MLRSLKKNNIEKQKIIEVKNWENKESVSKRKSVDETARMFTRCSTRRKD